MAGIGFELRKLTLRDDLLGVAQGYAHSATTAAGPWLFTILTLAGVVLVGSVNVAADDMTTFRLIIIYNFTFSLVLSGPFVMVATRVLADSIYARDVRQAPSMMLGYLIILFGVQALPVGAFYLWFVDLDLSLRLVAMFNFFVVSGIWLISTFLTALKDYTTITRSFVIGMGTAFFAAVLLAPKLLGHGNAPGFQHWSRTHLLCVDRACSCRVPVSSHAAFPVRTLFFEVLGARADRTCLQHGDLG